MAADLEGRVFVVTGANTGIGRVTAVELARRGGHVVLACRSRERTAEVLDQIRRETGSDRGEYCEIDLGSFASIRRAAARLLAVERPIHVLVNNAGLAGRRGRTEDGFELAFGVNHLGHFLLTNLLRERLIRSSPSRVVTVASAAHARAKGIDFEAVRRPTASVTGIPEYSVSKLANVLFSAQLARQLSGSGVTTYAVHPGVVASDLWRGVPWPIRPILGLFMISSEQGAKTTLHCATAPDLTRESGLYYDQCAPRKPSRFARDEELARRLWSFSAEATGVGEAP
ncbi:MAG: SDR family oxidoreductase [Deltaproteobacteria bacterium]|nr:SDR family oxidoreductase [Deltaproteobacteria bacterium]